MADLVTHVCVAYLCKVVARGAHVPVFIAGTVLPDLVCRVPAIVFSGASQRGLAVPWELMVGWEPLHLPVGMLVLSWTLSLLFREQERRSIFWNLLGGMGLHLLIDLLQDHYGVGYLLFFPAPLPSFELGWIGSEDSVVMALPLLAITMLIWWRRRGTMIQAGRDPEADIGSMSR